jgi:hypothetical protein
MSRDLTAVKTKQRIAAFDILRGFFLLVILIDHIELYPSGYDLFTGRGRLMVSAAEGFFFMSGLLLGIVYKRRISRGMRFIFKKMWLRGLELYVMSIVLTLLFTAAAFYLSHGFIKDGLYQSHRWPEIITQTLQMRYSFGWADFLTRFAKLMIFAPVGFYLLTKRKWWLLIGISAIVWGFRGQSFTAAWQAIFFGGMMLGYYWQQLVDWWRGLTFKARSIAKKTLAWTAAGTFAISWSGVFILSLLNQRLSTLPHWLQTFTGKWNSFHNYVWVYTQKWTLGPLRIALFLIWFWALFLLVNRYSGTLARYTRGYIELVGRNSLFVYVAHAFIVFIFKLYVIPSSTSLVENFIIASASLALLIGSASLYQRLRTNRSQNRQAAPEKTGKFYLRTGTAEP